ncbi:NmrA/HSCARG family protein [Ferruginibacter sp.]
MKQQTILVIGATGAQGGSVAKELLTQKKFAVRILTRNPTSDNALALIQQGAAVVKGNLDDKESLKEAMKDCYGVFGVTNFWEHYQNEYQQGKNLVDAVKESNIEHFVFHTLPSYFELSKGKYPVPHCDQKAALQEYAKSVGVKATFLRVAFYYENFFTFFVLQPAADGSYFFGFPQGDTPLAMISVEDVGGIVATIFDHPADYIGRTVGGVACNDTCDAYASIMSKALGKKIRYQYIPRDQYAAFDFPGAVEIANMFEVQRLHTPQQLVQINMIESYGLNPGMQGFEQWVKKNRHRFITSTQTTEKLSA